MKKQHIYPYKLGRKTYQLVLEFGRYQSGGRLYIGLNERNGDCFADLTVNISTLGTGLGALDADEIIVKDYDALPDLVQWCTAQGIATDTGKRVPSGFITAPVMRLTPEFMERHKTEILKA